MSGRASPRCSERNRRAAPLRASETNAGSDGSKWCSHSFTKPRRSYQDAARPASLTRRIGIDSSVTAPDCPIRRDVASADWQLCAPESRFDGEELPGSVDAFEVVLAAVVELEACSGDEHWDCGGDPELSGFGKFEDTSGDVHGDAGDFGAA